MTDREIDALVAEKVMGWTWDPKRCTVCGWPLRDPGKHAYECVPGNCTERPRPERAAIERMVGPFTTDIAAAFSVVEEMRRRGYVFEFEWWNTSENACTRFTDDASQRRDEEGDHWRPFSGAELPARAICLAALQALGVEIPS